MISQNHMIKISTIFALGILVAIVPYQTGFTSGFKDFIYIVSGVAIAVLSYLIRKELHEVLKHLHDVNITNNTEIDLSSDKK